MTTTHITTLARPPLFSRRRLLATTALAWGLGAAGAARAEGRIRIAEQFGIVYLLLQVADELNLVEKHGKAQGIDVKVEYVTLSGGSAVNDALLSGSIDLASAGVGPMLTLWDRTHGRHNVRGVASLGNLPYNLVSTNPAVRSIADLGEKDRIALPAVGVSMQARLLQMAVARQWGEAQFNRLDKFTLTLPHPEAAAALIKGGTEINGYFGGPPFQEQVLAANPQARVILKSYDVLGGPSSATVLYATERFRSENPRTYKAFISALAEASAFIRANPEQAADIFIRSNKSRVDRALVLQLIRSPDVSFTLQPQNTLRLAEFMHRVGGLKNKPASARDYFFDDPHNAGAT